MLFMQPILRRYRNHQTIHVVEITNVITYVTHIRIHVELIVIATLSNNPNVFNFSSATGSVRLSVFRFVWAPV